MNETALNAIPLLFLPVHWSQCQHLDLWAFGVPSLMVHISAPFWTGRQGFLTAGGEKLFSGNRLSVPWGYEGLVGMTLPCCASDLTLST